MVKTDLNWLHDGSGFGASVTSDGGRTRGLTSREERFVAPVNLTPTGEVRPQAVMTPTARKGTDLSGIHAWRPPD